MQPRRRWTLVATILGSSLTVIDATVVNVALPALQSDLQATITDPGCSLPIVGLALLRPVFVDPLSADRPHVAFRVRPFAADPRPDADGEDE